MQPKYLIAFALGMECLSLYAFTSFDTGISFWDSAIGRAWQAFPIPFLFIPLTAAAYVGLPRQQDRPGVRQLNVFRNLGGTIGISSMQTLLAQREQFHQSHLVERLNPLNPNYTSALATLRGALVGRLGPAAAEQGGDGHAVPAGGDAGGHAVLQQTCSTASRSSWAWSSPCLPAEGRAKGQASAGAK